MKSSRPYLTYGKLKKYTIILSKIFNIQIYFKKNIKISIDYLGKTYVFKWILEIKTIDTNLSTFNKEKWVILHKKL